MIAMEVEEMVILDDRLRILFFFKKRFAPLHDDVRVVVFLDRIPEENRFVGSAQCFLGCGVGIFRTARAGHQQAKRSHPEGQREASPRA